MNIAKLIYKIYIYWLINYIIDFIELQIWEQSWILEGISAWMFFRE